MQIKINKHWHLEPYTRFAPAFLAALVHTTCKKSPRIGLGCDWLVPEVSSLGACKHCFTKITKELQDKANFIAESFR